ncbi:MAG: hypothetical protein ACJ79H_21740 [Myxococcales bacterium]
MAGVVESGVSSFEGIFSKWFGWARNADTNVYREGPVRWFKWQARRDANKLRSQVA